MLVFPAGCLAFLVGEFSYLSLGDLDPTSGASAPASDVFEASIWLVWNAVPIAALVGLILIGVWVFPRGIPVVAVTCVIFTAAIVSLLLEMNVDDSSTSVLLLIFLPFYLGFGLVPFLGLTALVHWLRGCKPAAVHETGVR